MNRSGNDTSNCKLARGAAWVFLVLVSVFAAACSGGGGGGGNGGGSGPLQVVSFEGGGTTQLIYRDTPLIFEFSQAIDPQSVSVEGLQVRLNGDLVPGRIEVDGREVRWFAVVLPGDRNDYAPANVPPINGLGLFGKTRYTVQIANDALVALKSRRGRPLANAFTSSFTTAEGFAPEEDPTPPALVGMPVFSPPPVVDGDPFSPDPEDWPMLDPREVNVRIDFTERIDPAGLDPFRVVTMTNITEGVDEPGVGEPALVRLSPTPSADGIDMEALVSLGDDPDTLDPYHFEVRIGRELTDLGGTPLDDDIVFHFRTIDRPGESNYLVITETFDTTDWLDNVQSNAVWGPDDLLGADPAARSIEYIPRFSPRPAGVPPANTFNLPHPLVEVGNASTPLGSAFMMQFRPNEVGTVAGESIVGMAWAPKSQFAFFSTYNVDTFALGHKDPAQGANLNFQFERNYDRTIPNNPTVVYQGPYTVQANRNARWVDWPQFLTDFEYSGGSNLLFFWDMPEGGDTFQLFNNDSTASLPYNRIFANGGSAQSRSGRENTQYEFRFDVVSKSSVAVSLARPVEFNGSALSAPDYEAALVLEDAARAGTQVNVAFAAGNSAGDSVPLSQFVDSLNSVDGSSFVAFRVLLTANPFTSTVPRVFSVSFAVADLDR